MGLQWAIKQTWTPLVVEGDSKLIITLARMIQSGKRAEAIGKNWRMAARLGFLESILRNSPVITFHHVRRKANGVVDAFANHAMKQNDEVVECEWDDLTNPGLKERCSNLAHTDLSTAPAAGDNNDTHVATEDPRCGQEVRPTFEEVEDDGESSYCRLLGARGGEDRHEEGH